MPYPQWSRQPSASHMQRHRGQVLEATSHPCVPQPRQGVLSGTPQASPSRSSHLPWGRKPILTPAPTTLKYYEAMVSYCGDLCSYTSKGVITQPPRLLETDLPARENTEEWQPQPPGDSAASGVDLVQPFESKLSGVQQSSPQSGQRPCRGCDMFL